MSEYIKRSKNKEEEFGIATGRIIDEATGKEKDLTFVKDGEKTFVIGADIGLEDPDVMDIDIIYTSENKPKKDYRDEYK